MQQIKLACVLLAWSDTVIAKAILPAYTASQSCRVAARLSRPWYTSPHLQRVHSSSCFGTAREELPPDELSAVIHVLMLTA